MKNSIDHTKLNTWLRLIRVNCQVFVSHTEDHGRSEAAVIGAQRDGYADCVAE